EPRTTNNSNANSAATRGRVARIYMGNPFLANRSPDHRPGIHTGAGEHHHVPPPQSGTVDPRIPHALPPHRDRMFALYCVLAGESSPVTAPAPAYRDCRSPVWSLCIPGLLRGTGSR